MSFSLFYVVLNGSINYRLYATKSSFFKKNETLFNFSQ